MSATPHFDSASWLAYAETAIGAVDREQMDLHAADCTACRSLRRSSTELVSALADTRTWEEAEPAAAPAGTLFERIRDAAVAHARNRSRAASYVSSLLKLPDADIARALSNPPIASPALVRELASHARGALERDPQRALFLADLADSVARELEGSSESLQAHGLALKEKGNALRFLGRLKESLAAYDESRARFLASPLGAIDAAQVDLGRALVYREMGELSQAGELAQESARTFVEFGDSRRALHARFLAGGISFSLGKIDEAKDIFLELLIAAQEQHDLDSLARLFNNIGRCYVELGEPETASTYLLQAIATYRELGMETEVIRTHWALARMLLHAGNAADASTRLAEVAADFTSRGMLLESALATLDRVEALLVLGRTGDVPLLIESILARFNSAGAQPAAIIALAYLHEAARAGNASRKKVTHVRSFLERLPQEPQLLFLPMPE